MKKKQTKIIQHFEKKTLISKQVPLDNKLNITFLKAYLTKASTTKNRPLKMHSIKTKFSFAFISFALIPLISICIVYTFISKNALRTTSSTLNLEIVRVTGDLINTEFSNVEASITQFAINDLPEADILAQLRSKDSTAQASAIMGIRQLLTSLKTSNKNLKSSSLISNDATKMIGNVASLSEATLRSYITDDTASKYLWLMPDELGNQSVLLVKTFSDVSTHSEYTIFSEMTLSRITDYLDSASLLKDSHIYLISDTNGLIYSPDKDETALTESILKHLNNEEALATFSNANALFSYSVLDNGWKLLVETPTKSLTTQLDSALVLVIIIALVIIALAYVLGKIYGGSFSKPILILGQLMKKAEDGDLTVSAPVNGNDEITDLCKSFNHMMYNIKNLINETQEVIGHVLNSSETLQTSTGQSAEAMKELSSAISEIAEGTTSQALDSQKNAQNMGDLSSSMEKVTKQTESLISHTSGAKTMIENATSTMHSLTETMSSSLKISSDISSSVSELSRLNKNIEDVIKLLDSVSEQTNLLALNASIEAARVGEAGKGFAVVANEVRHLADQSKASTNDVRQTLTMITTKMKSTVSLADESRKIIHSQETVVQDTRLLFDEIVNILSNMTSELHMINESIQDMQDLKKIMATQIQSIANVTEEAAASTEEVNSLTEEQQNVISQLSSLSSSLTEHMHQLNDKILSFKVN